MEFDLNKNLNNKSDRFFKGYHVNIKRYWILLVFKITFIIIYYVKQPLKYIRFCGILGNMYLNN